MCKKQQINKKHELIIEKKVLLGLDPAIPCILRLRSSTCAFSEVTINHLNVIDEQVNVYSTGTYV